MDAALTPIATAAYEANAYQRNIIQSVTANQLVRRAIKKSQAKKVGFSKGWRGKAKFSMQV